MKKPDKRILIIDDEPLLLELIFDIFLEEKWIVEKAENGLEALNKMGTFQPNVILSDVNMPKMDGLKFLDTLFEQGSLIPVVFLSGFRDNLVMEVVDKLPKETDKNFIVVPSTKSQNLKLILNTYKTDKKYSQDIIPVPKELSKEIRKYIDNHGIEYGKFLFGKSKLSGFIAKFNEKMDLPVKVSINKLRQMKVSKVYENNPSVEERVKLAHQMKHSPTTSEKYVRKIIKNIDV
jgi:CheY-like chemotaxis protein